MFPLSLLHDDDDDDVRIAVSPPQRKEQRLRKSQSTNVIGLIGTVVRHPVDSVGSVLARLVQWQTNTTLDRGAEGGDEELEPDYETQRQIFYLRMKEADDYERWHAAATALDALEGNDAWKADSPFHHPASLPPTCYNATLIKHRLDELDNAKLNCDAPKMLFLIRTTLSRNLGGMNNLRLYRHSHVGTKVLTEKYIESTLHTLSSLLSISGQLTGKSKSGRDSGRLDPKVVLDQLLAARQAFGRSALLLSGGGTFGMNHIGVVKCLWEQNLLPRIISGSSAGSIVCAVLATRNDEEIPSTLQEMCSGDLAVFEDPKAKEEAGPFAAVKRFLTYGAVFESKHLVRVMRDLLGDITFQEAYNRTRRILNICVSSASLYELPRLLNYVTAPNVIIWSAVSTSCSVPLIFTPSSILAKDPKTGAHVPWNGPSPSLTAQRWIDGSVDNDLPMMRLAEMFNVNHFIVSQVNPHVVPFLRSGEGASAEVLTTNGGNSSLARSWLNTATSLAKGELLYRMHVLTDMQIFPTTLTKARSILSQRYSGDITILPEIPYSQFPLVLQNPTPEFMLSAMRAGERATWPKLSRIRNSLSIEMALDDAIGEARGRVVFSKSQVDLRLNSFGRLGIENGVRGRARGRRKHDAWRHGSDTTFESGKETVNKVKKSHGKPHHSTRPPGRFLIPKLKVSSSSATMDEDEYSDLEARKHASAFAFSSSPLSSSPGSSSTELDSASDGDPDIGGIRTAIPELWPSNRSFFPSVPRPSGINTSSGTPRSGRRAVSPALITTSDTPPVTSQRHSLNPFSRSNPTLPRRTGSSTNQSEPERGYKRLFHPRQPTPAAVTPPITLPTPTASSTAHFQPSHRHSVSESVLSATQPTTTDLGARDESSKSIGSSAAGHHVEPLPVDGSGMRGMVFRKKGKK